MKCVAPNSGRSTHPEKLLRLAGIVCLTFCGTLGYLSAPVMAQAPGNQELPSGPSGNSKPIPITRSLQGISPSGGVTPADYTPDEIEVQPLVDVQVEGNDTIETWAILQKLESKAGRPPSERTVNQDVSALYNTRWFISVTPIYRQTDNGPVLVFQVIERPSIRKVEFIGNEKIKTGELEALTGLRVMQAFDVTANRESVHRIKELYKEKGYYFAEVTLEKGGDPDDREVVIRIHEGKKLKIGKIEIIGNEFSSDAILKTKISSKTVKLWIIQGNYDPDVIRNDAMALKNYYLGLGFFDVDITYEEIFSDDKSRVTIRFTVDEGERAKVGKIEVYGNDVFARDRLLHDLHLKSGDYFNARFLREDVDAMKDLYDNQGRLFTKVEPTPFFRAEDGNWVDIIYQIEEDVPRYIGELNIQIVGDYTHSKEETVRQQVHRYLKPGQLARARDIRMAQSRVTGSGIWDRTKPPAFDIHPSAGADYLPQIASRGQDSLAGVMEELRRNNLLPTSLSTEAAEPEVFGHRLADPDWLNEESPFGSGNGEPASWTESVAVPRAFPTLLESIEIPAQDEPQSEAVRPESAVPANASTSNSALDAHQGHRFSSSPAEQRHTSQRWTPPADSHRLVASATPVIPRQRAEERAPQQSARRSARPTGFSDSVQIEQRSCPAGPTEPNPFLTALASPDEVLNASDGEETITRAQDAPIYRAQALDSYGNQVPQDYLRDGGSPQGDPFGDALSAPPPGFVDIDIDVAEGRTGRLMFGAGINSNSGVVGQIILQEDNFNILRVPTSWADVINGRAFRGAGQSFRLEAVPGNRVSRYLVNWQDPFFLRSNFSLGVSGFYYNRYFQDWTEDRIGGRVSLGYVLNRYWSLSSALRLEDVGIRSVATPTPPDLAAVKGSNFLSTIAGTVSYDRRDSAFMPSKGNFANFTYEQGFGEFNYPRFELTGGQYFTTYERPDGFGKQILAITGQAGWSGDNTPIFERFYAGGFSSFRGFRYRGVTPLVNGVQVGGNWMFLGSVEYMVPVTASDNIRLVTFSDFGTIEPDIGFDAFRVTAGFGVRLMIPAMGPAPLAFDFAWPILKEDFDDTQVFSFTMGFTR